MSPMNNRLMRPRASGGFDPRTVSGLIMWLDASASNTITPASSPLADGGAITTWSDRSGLGQSMAQTSAANRPTYSATGVGGKPAIAFAAASSQFMAGTFSHALTQMSMYFVGTVTGVNNSDRIVSLNVSGQSNDFGGTNSFAPLLRVTSANVGANYSGSSNLVQRPYTPGTPFISNVSHSGSVLSQRVNNGTAATHSASLNTTYGGMVFGSVFSTGFVGGFSGQIAELLFWNRAVTSAENDSIISYLSKKYGITVA